VYMSNVSLFVPNIGAGIYVCDLESKKFFAGISVPHLLPYSLRWNKVASMNDNSVAKLYNYYLATAGYVIGKPQSVVKVEPSFLAMWQQGLPKNIPDFDINLMLILFDRLKLGVSYRTGGDNKMVGQGMVGMFEVKVTSQLRVGYAFDGNISGISAVNKGSHEIMLGYDFLVNKKRYATPRYGRYF
jgi:type IX secretion system PorP/SprF family membrane protein